MNGQWIWLNDGISSENERGCFTETITVENKNKKVFLRISADTRYIAYINGKEIGRGPIRSTLNDWFYDEYDITMHLVTGCNLFAVRVWNYGWSTYQSIASQGGLLFDVVQGDTVMTASGQHTRCARDLGHKQNTVKRNVNLGFTDYYDARQFDSRWLDDKRLTSGWQHARPIRNIWGKLKKRPIKPFHSEIRYPQRIVEFAEVRKECQQVSVNTRRAFFGDRVDADETIFTGFIGCIVDSPVSMAGIISFPNRTWNGILGDFKIDETRYKVDNTHRDIPVRLKKGQQLFLLQVSGKYDDLYCHMTFRFPEEIRFQDIDGCLERPFFVIGPTDRIIPCIDGYSRVYGGLVEYNRMETHTELHQNIFACRNASEISVYHQRIKPVGSEDIYYDEYIYSLIRNAIRVKQFPITDNLCGILWSNSIPSVIPQPAAEDFQRIILDFEDVYVGSLEFSLNASQGTILDIYCFENMFEGTIDYTVGLNNAVRYICREGYQDYRCMTRMGCRFAAITIKNQTRDLEIYHFQIRHATYSPTNMGTFRCNDALLNRIWEISKRTHLLCMEDSFTDCPTYEQAFWIGDAQISSYINAYAFGEYDLIRRNVRLAASASEHTPLMNALTPTDWVTAIPMWTMNWVLSVEWYRRITGDDTIVHELYPPMKETLLYYAGLITEDGAFLINAWNMLDWADMDIHNHGVVTGQQAILAYCFKVLADYAQLLGCSIDRAYFTSIRNHLLQYIDRALWDTEKRMFVDGWSPEYGYATTVSIQTHSLLLFFDAVTDPEKRRLAEQYLINPPDCFLRAGSPFILFYQYQVWADCGLVNQLLEDIKNRWGEMLRYDSTTCWEVFPGFYEANRTRSYCHSWSASPVYFLGKYVLGVSIKENGFRKIEIAVPDIALTWCEGSIPTPFGMLHVHWRRENGEKSYTLSVPSGIDVCMSDRFDWKLTINKLSPSM